MLLLLRIVGGMSQKVLFVQTLRLVSNARIVSVIVRQQLLGMPLSVCRAKISDWVPFFPCPWAMRAVYSCWASARPGRASCIRWASSRAIDMSLTKCCSDFSQIGKRKNWKVMTEITLVSPRQRNRDHSCRPKCGGHSWKGTTIRQRRYR